MADEFRQGDVLRLSCPFTEARVMDVSRFSLSIKWPWWQVDPESVTVCWNGNVALPRDPGQFDWDLEFFRTAPGVEGLAAGSLCKVGIPPTVVHVIAVHHFAPPLETGRLPRPRRYVDLLRQGQSQDLGLEEQGYSIDPDDDQPIELELLFRPYAFLEVGDEIADKRGRAWRFDAPWDWHPFDGSATRAPSWPLTLLFRGGEEPTLVSVDAVAVATATGSHERELSQWCRLTGATPPVNGSGLPE